MRKSKNRSPWIEPSKPWPRPELNSGVKFRAWHEDNKAFEYVDIKEIWKNGFRVREAFSREFKHKNVEMQRGGTFCTDDALAEMASKSFVATVAHWDRYTGLHDKNGVEIYEGDIVNHRTWADDPTWTDKVAWNDDICGWEPFCSLWHYSEDYLDKETVEVIGNRFENPELLND